MKIQEIEIGKKYNIESLGGLVLEGEFKVHLHPEDCHFNKESLKKIESIVFNKADISSFCDNKFYYKNDLVENSQENHLCFYFKTEVEILSLK